MVTDLISSRDIANAKALITESGLRFEDSYDSLVGIYDNGQLIATGALDGKVLKMLCIEPESQCGSCLGEMVTELIRIGFSAGKETFFVFTRPQFAGSFQALNFHPLVHHPETTLLEYGGGLSDYLKSHRDQVRPGVNGAVVVNCNPFTLGHRYLIEQAATEVDHLYVFVVREDRSVFPFDVRYRLVREGVKDLENVTVLDSSHYAVSSVTFPGYFLKDPDMIERTQMEVDLMLFGSHIAPFFCIKKRFIGTEPYCRTTRSYSDTMLRVLPPLGIETVQLDRIQEAQEAVSAFRVRTAMRNEAYETVRRLVPNSTYTYLMSDEARDLRETLRRHNRRH